MTSAITYTDLLYDEKDGIATITINRPEKHNAFRGRTCDELLDAFNRAGRQLQDQVRRMRGKVKHHAEAQTGAILRLMPEDGYGFLESADGRFTEEEGEEGPQASWVTPLAESAPR